MKLGSVLLLPATGLRVTAAALRLFASTGQRLADLLNPDSGDGADARPTVGTAPARPAPVRPAPVRSATTSPSPAAAPTPAVPLDLATLAARPAPEIIAALDSLGTVELADLYEHESKHRRRRAVLDAITAATAPPTPAADADLELLDDVRVPDELVYTTQTPGR